MNNLGFVIAGYGVVLGGLLVYTLVLLRRLRIAREISLRIRRESEAAPPLPDRRA